MGLLLDSLRSVDFFSAESEETVVRFMVLGKSADFAKSHVFWRAGKRPESLVIPVSGEAKTSTRSREGREFIDRLVGAGECVGLASALDGLGHPNDAEVVRAGEFFTISNANFHRFLDAHPEVHAKATTMVGALYRSNLREREDVALRPAPERLAAYLVRNVCVRRADGARTLVRATQAEMAARLGTVREIVARVLADLERRGIIEREQNVVFISDWRGLRAEAGLDPDGGDDDAVRGDSQAEPRQRTTRFFLPAIERLRRQEDADEAAKCLAYLGDLSACRAKRCFGALDAQRRRAAPPEGSATSDEGRRRPPVP